MSDINSTFLEMITPLLPDPKEAEIFAEACTKPVKKSLTINVCKISVDEFKSIVEPMGRTLTPHAFHDTVVTFFVDREDLSLALGNTFLYRSGYFYIQELAASMPALEIDSKPGDIILDVAAAPGGKTSQLANMLLAQWKAPGLVVANDISGPRLQTLAHNLNMQGAYNTAITKFNGSMFGKHLPEFFDHVLVDAPCSGEGTSFKSDTALSFWRQEDVNKIAGTQMQILISSLKTVKVGGTVVYSTCTLNPYENEWTLARVLDFFEGSIELESVHYTNCEDWMTYSTDDRSFSADQAKQVKRFWPHIQKTGWFFVSKLRKVSTTINTDRPKVKDHKLLPKNQFKLQMNKQLQKDVAKYADEYYWVKVDAEKHFFVASKEKVYLVSPQFLTVQKHLNCEKVWIPVFKIDRKTGFRPTHYFGNILWTGATKRVIEFTDEQMQEYSLGKLVPAPVECEWGYRIIKRRGKGMSVTKKVGEDWKNKMGK